MTDPIPAAAPARPTSGRRILLALVAVVVVAAVVVAAFLSVTADSDGGDADAAEDADRACEIIGDVGTVDGVDDPDLDRALGAAYLATAAAKGDTGYRDLGVAGQKLTEALTYAADLDQAVTALQDECDDR